MKTQSKTTALAPAVLAIGGAAALMCASCMAPGATYFGFTTGVDAAPPPPRVVVVEQPAVAPVPNTRVYVVSDPSLDYDMFRFGATWYLFYGGYWYRSASYGGPFAAVDVRYVPREVVTVPRSHWKHHPHGGPPGRERRRERED